MNLFKFCQDELFANDYVEEDTVTVTVDKADKDMASLTRNFAEVAELMVDFKTVYKDTHTQIRKQKSLKETYCGTK